MSNENSVGYMIVPLDLTERQLLIYQKIYQKCDFSNMTAKYTYEQLASDIKLIDISKKIANDEVKSLIKSGYLQEIEKGRRGKASTFKVVKISEILGNYSVTNRELLGNLKHSDTKALEGVEGTNKELIGNYSVTPIKEKEKENNIYSVIFDFWISKNIKNHRSISLGIKKSIDKTLKEYSKDEILEAINNYGDMLNSNYEYCNYKWGLDEFLVKTDKDRTRQLPKFLNEGSKYLNYLSWKNGNNLCKPQRSKAEIEADLI